VRLSGGLYWGYAVGTSGHGASGRGLDSFVCPEKGGDGGWSRTGHAMRGRQATKK
jgi:hypothetical protein